ncbi:MAG TPA: S8 family serine peptidase [Actinomycetota bacterium]|nr:S8 family serine peptidase [Actinomycetota bacterium]
MDRFAAMPARRGRLARLAIVLSVAAVGTARVAPGAGATHTDPAAPNDPLYVSQWGPRQVRAEQAWDVTQGLGAVVAVVDTGIDLDHPDLAANIVPGNTFLGCGTAGCGNGDWQSGSRPGDATGHLHGTHVAGIAAAVTNNGVGIAGVAPQAKLMAVRVLDGEGSGSFADVALGIRYAADNGADVINLSLGALPGSQVFTITGLLTDVVDAIAYANSRGVVVVAAAGNEAAPMCDTPGFDPGAVCITATDKREAKAAYANHPVRPDLQSVAAPGGAGIPLCYEDIVSTVPPGTGGTYCGYPGNRAYDEYAGTSMATPHAAGVAGLLASMGCTRQQNVDVLTSTARQPVTGSRGVWTPEYGYGIVDAQAAVQAALTAC